jgi:hypothetical protein
VANDNINLGPSTTLDVMLELGLGVVADGGIRASAIDNAG